MSVFAKMLAPVAGSGASLLALLLVLFAVVPVAMFIDNISIWLAYYIWTLSPTAGGQESSTRYIKISIDGLISPETLGLPKEKIPEWRQLMEKCFLVLDV